MQEELFSWVDPDEMTAFLRRLCADLVRKARPLVDLEVAKARFRAELLPDFDAMANDIRYDPVEGWRFHERAITASKWLAFNIPAIEFYRTLDEGFGAEIERVITPEFQKVFGE